MKQQPILSVRNLKKQYRDRVILDIPGLRFERGGLYAVVGPNGAGKTTLLKILSFLEKPSEGAILYEGHEVDFSTNGISSPRRQVTLVMQDPLLFRTTVLKNVAYGLWVRGMDGRQRNRVARQVLEIVDLSDWADEPAHHLSSGEAQRVALARALATQPKVLMLDEPTANLDRSNTALIEDTLRDINGRHGTTILFTTHNLAQTLSRETISLLDGRLEGTEPDNLWQ